MKKVFALLLSCALLLPCFGTLAFAEEAETGILEIMVDGEMLSFAEAKPFIENDRTLVPLSALCTALGITEENIAFTDGKVSLTGVVNGTDCTVSLSIGSPIAKVNGEEKELDVAAKIVEDATFVPLRFVSELFGCRVQFYGATPVYGNRSLVEITTPAYARFGIYMPQELADEGVNKLFEVAAAITGINAVDTFVAVNDVPVEKMTLMLAAGEQCLFVDNGYLSDEQMKTLAEMGLFAKLDTWMEQYAPETYANILADETLKASMSDDSGNIVAFPVERNGKTERVLVSFAADTEKAVALIHAYNEVVKSLAE